MDLKKIFGIALIGAAIAIAGAGCSKKEAPEAADAEEEEGAAGQEGAAAAAVAVDLASGATISGSVKFAGDKPKPLPIRMDAEPTCHKEHGNAPVPSEEVTINDNGTLRYALVYIRDGLGNKTYKPIDPKVLLDQKGCLYTPHVLFVVAGQEIEISNSDQTTHNIHPIPRVNREWNESQAPGSPMKKVFQQPEMPPMPVKCNIHPWMKSYIAVLRHPFASVSTKDGSFEIKGVPAGSYTLEVWHEKLGTVEQKVTVAAKEAKSVEFTMTAKGS
jgi:plastocyanin